MNQTKIRPVPALILPGSTDPRPTHGEHFVALSGQERIVFDEDTPPVEEEAPRHQRKDADDAD